MTLPVFEHDEIDQRMRRILAGMSHPITDVVVIGCFRLTYNSAGSLLTTDTGDLVYHSARKEGLALRWNRELFGEALEALRKHMVLDDMADV